MRIKTPVTLVLMLICGNSAFCADYLDGRKIFRQQCMLCHSAEPGDGGGAQGPKLYDVFGRKAASGAAFGYTQALKDSKLVWDAQTLARFLEAPTRVVPGTSMVNAVPAQKDRENLVAYFQALQDGTIKSVAAPAPSMPLASARKGTADWKNDKPGRVHRIAVADLPQPFATSSADNSPQIIARPKGAQLSVPAGFKVEVFASKLKNPRRMRIAPNGDIFLSEPGARRVLVLRPSVDGSTAASIDTFAEGLEQPFGMQFYPAGGDPKWLYVAELNRVVRFAYAVGDRQARSKPEVVVQPLSHNTTGGHSTRDLAFSSDGKRLFVSVGSLSNVAEQMAKKTAEEVKQWEAQRALGAAWDTEENRADVLVFDTDSPGAGKIFATGIRNCVGLTVQPATGDLWCTVNERDELGDDLVPDYSTRVKEGGYYGWPWYYLGNHEDPRHKGERPDLAGKAIVPDVLYTAHSAALNLAFYVANSGKSAFPQEYVGDGFAVLHGSWNRAFRTGHKVVRVRMKNNAPTGEYEDFLTGFIVDDGDVWGRPVDLAQLSDGSLLMTDDGGKRIYRISYSR
jgi:glucose/arabinose dehydrogenase